jgi:uncharacterized ferritin-like protein (DUF455 family)
MTLPPQPDWAPFEVAPNGAHADAPRSIHTPEGMGDRMRAAAFAELQAVHAFSWGAEHFETAPSDLREAWRGLVADEQRHFDWIMNRMRELDIPVTGRKVSDQLWHSLMACKTPEEFAIYIASAEERGRRAGIRFVEAFQEKDPITAEIFKKIVEEEISHVELVQKFYPASDLRSGRI